GINAFLQAEMESVIQSSDALIAVLPIDEKAVDKVNEIIDIVKESKKPWIALITKTDIKEKVHRIDILKSMLSDFNVPTLTISTVKGKGVDRDTLLEAIRIILPAAPEPLYPDVELFTPHHVRDLVSEIIREQCFENLYQEVPYGVAVRILKFEEPAEKKIYKIYAEILASKESFKPIIVGKEAAVIKKIGTAARLEIEKLVGEKVFLDLQVKVKENWNENKKLLKELGYDANDVE
ncbi:MAG: KH domain-containing protein, partial [Pseudobdellovibrionaceae bacterium]